MLDGARGCTSPTGPTLRHLPPLRDPRLCAGPFSNHSFSTLMAVSNFGERVTTSDWLLVGSISSPFTAHPKQERLIGYTGITHESVTHLSPTGGYAVPRPLETLKWTCFITLYIFKHSRSIAGDSYVKEGRCFFLRRCEFPMSGIGPS